MNTTVNVKYRQRLYIASLYRISGTVTRHKSATRKPSDVLVDENVNEN